MTTANDTPEESESDQTPTTTAKPKKKSRSPGFIETSNFKPSWLETGPLSPDMLPPEVMAQVVEEATSGDRISDDLLAQIAELERLYNEASDQEMAAESTAQAASMAEAAEPEQLLMVETQEVAVESIPEVEPVPDAPIAMIEALVVEEIAAPAEPELFVIEAASIYETSEPEIEPLTVVPDQTAGLDEFIVDNDEPPLAAAAVTAPVVAPKVKPSKHAKPAKQARTKRQHPFFDRLARLLLLFGLLLLGLAALTYFVNPFARLALSTAELARPVSSPSLASPAGAATEWCATGDFMAEGDAPLRLLDNGQQGDIVAGDQVFALQVSTLPAGNYQWQVVGCELGELAYPAAQSWIQVDTASQPVTFMFDSAERDDPLFFPIPFAVSAIDSAARFQVVGSFQDWNPDDASAVLQHQGGGIYQQVRRIARPGDYEAFVISGSEGQAIDAYGRTIEPIPFSFETSRSSEVVVFLLDTNRGRASVLYGMPWVASQLAYGPAFRILSVVLGLGGLLLLAWMLLRMIMMGNSKKWLEAGCPQCKHQELMRISRTTMDRLLNALGIPAYHYQCRNCTWTGTRLSEEGASVSPGATTIVADTLR